MLALRNHVWPGSFTAPSPKAMCAAAWSIVFFYVSKTGGSSWAWCYACRIAGTLPLVIIDESQNKILLPGRANCLVIYFVCPLLNILHRKDTLKCEQEPWDSLNARLAGDVQNRHACRLTRLTQPGESCWVWMKSCPAICHHCYYGYISISKIQCHFCHGYESLHRTEQSDFSNLPGQNKLKDLLFSTRQKHKLVTYL